MHFEPVSGAYATHQLLLYNILTLTTGPVIEFGSGLGSTALIHKVCQTKHRKVITLDDNEEWLDRYSDKFGTPWHKFIHVHKSKNEAPDAGAHWQKVLMSDVIKNGGWDLVFIDQSPWIARYDTLLQFKDNAKYIMVHDCDYFPKHNIFGQCDGKEYNFDDVFKCYEVYYPPKPWPSKTGPPTLLGSNMVSELPKRRIT